MNTTKIEIVSKKNQQQKKAKKNIYIEREYNFSEEEREKKL